MRIPFFRPVVPPDVFCLLPEGITYASVRRDPPRGFAQARHFPFPPNTVGVGGSGTPLYTREAVLQSVDSGRRLSGGRLARATALFPDSWARMMPIDMETVPDEDDATREMVLWKLKKLLPGVTAGEQRRLLVAAAPADTLRSIEDSFEAAGVRIGLLLPFSLALFEGLSPTLASRAAGDYGLLHRSADSFVFLVARDGAPVFFRQRPSDETEGDHDQEVRLSLSYYTEKLKGAGISRVFVHDGRGDGVSETFPGTVEPLAGRLFEADATFDERVSARPELLPAFAAVYGRV